MTFFNLLPDEDVERIHAAAFRVLADTGVCVESKQLLSLLGDFSGTIDPDASRVRFSPPWVEQFIADSGKYDWAAHRPTFRTWAGVYACHYLNPETGELEPFTEQTFGDYVRLGAALDQIDQVSNLGIPFLSEGIPPAYGALAEKLYGWKYGAHPSGSVQFTGLCPYLEEIYARRSEEEGRSLKETFHAGGFLISPLRLARAECEQILYFRARGLRMGVGHLLSIGSSAPVTIGGAAVLNIAESLFLGILHRALWGDRGLRLGAAIMVMDMRTTMSLYGRPELAMVSAILAQVARWYGVASGSFAGLSDAKEPSAQAGMQKAMGSVAGLCSCGGSTMDAGLLSVDEICSPEQLIYDNELAGAIRRLIRPVDLTDEALAVGEIAEVGPGGAFIGTDLTAKRFRTELWQPSFWARESTKEWLAAGAVSDREKARKHIREILGSPRGEPGLTEECERDVRAIIARAVAADAAE